MCRHYWLLIQGSWSISGRLTIPRRGACSMQHDEDGGSGWSHGSRSCGAWLFWFRRTGLALRVLVPHGRSDALQHIAWGNRRANVLSLARNSEYRSNAGPLHVQLGTQGTVSVVPADIIFRALQLQRLGRDWGRQRCKRRRRQETHGVTSGFVTRRPESRGGSVSLTLQDERHRARRRKLLGWGREPAYGASSGSPLKAGVAVRVGSGTRSLTRELPRRLELAVSLPRVRR